MESDKNIKNCDFSVSLKNVGPYRNKYGSFRYKTRFFYNGNLDQVLNSDNYNKQKYTKYKTRWFCNKNLEREKLSEGLKLNLCSDKRCKVCLFAEGLSDDDGIVNGLKFCKVYNCVSD